jgi:sulfite exporter TauE/SafE
LNTWVSVLTASLLGSLHCVGMCGGLVTFYSAGDGAANAARWVPHATYHLTRLLAYLLLGALAGGLGSALDLFGARVGLGDLGVFVAGLTLVFWGVPLLWKRGSASPLLVIGRGPARRFRLVQWLEGFFVALAARVRRRPPTWRAGALGMASALLPCGWLYAFVVLAAGTGSWTAGAGLLAAFWLGTVPALLGLAVGVRRLGAPLRARLPRFSAALVLLVCVFNIMSRWPNASAGEPSASARAGAMSCHGQH